MTYGNFPEYQLAEKMKNRFSGRGASLSGMQASSTSELMRRAQMGGDPSVNCSELDFGNAANRRPVYANNPAGRNRTRNTHPQNAPGTAARSTASARAAAGTAARTGNPNRMDNRIGERPSPSGARKKSAPSKSAGTASSHAKASAASGNGSRTKTSAKKREAAPEVREIKEVRAEGRRMTPMFAVFLLIGTMMIMSIVLSFSEIYQTTSEISQLEDDLDELKDRAAELELELEEKNDIRVIEQIAAEQLGMVKEDAVQRKYLSLSDGERIDLHENDEALSDGTQKASGVLLSSIWSSLGSLFDYFR
ncbi:MAG: septum formation initiator family protein [Eubacteriales bacterium]